MSYNDLTALQGPIRYEKTGYGHLKMVGHGVPYSIVENEFDYIYQTIVENSLKAGFEVATAFGISSLAAGLGFKETGGKLVSMDAYIEEMTKDAGTYKDLEPAKYEDTDGWKSAHFLRSHFGLEDVITYKVGWSPTDTAGHIEWSFGIYDAPKKDILDYAFIDGGHFSEQIMQDIAAIAPYLQDGAFVFFHDVYPESFTDGVKDYIARLLGAPIQVVMPNPHGENLGVVEVIR